MARRGVEENAAAVGLECGTGYPPTEVTLLHDGRR
jgi:hypothetical protein